MLNKHPNYIASLSIYIYIVSLQNAYTNMHTIYNLDISVLYFSIVTT